MLNFIYSKWMREKRTTCSENKYKFLEDFFQKNWATQMRCRLSQSRPFHVVTGFVKPKQKRGRLSPLLTLTRPSSFFLIVKRRIERLLQSSPVYCAVQGKQTAAKW